MGGRIKTPFLFYHFTFEPLNSRYKKSILYRDAILLYDVGASHPKNPFMTRWGALSK